jgi:Smg protein
MSATADTDRHRLTDSTMIDNTVFDILIYVFDRYMLEELPASPERESLARDLESAGFAEANVERALDWLADLACERDRPPLPLSPKDKSKGPTVRIFSDGELARLSTECRGFLFTLERLGILSPQQREIVIERMLALDADELDTEQLKWVVLMVLSSQPGQELAFERLEDLVSDAHPNVPH